MDAGQNYLIPFEEKNTIQQITRKLYLNDQSFVDINWNGLKIINQLVWTLALVFMVVATIKANNSGLILKLTILGGFVFLLLFEGGRSRYLIQFLPYLITLSSLGIAQLLDKKISKNKC